MLVRALTIEGLRNIRDGQLELEGANGLVLGGNGAGKTTVLESVYLLARGRSFRGRRAGDLTTVGLKKTRIRGVLEHRGMLTDWAFARGPRDQGRWVDGVSLGEAADRNSRLAVRLVGENAPILFEGDPSLRRRFLDWNLFHVEHGYGNALTRYRGVLEQRNAWLRQGARGRPVWDEELIRSGEHLHRFRDQGFRVAQAAFGKLAQDFQSLIGILPAYLSGIPKNCTFEEALAADTAGEKNAGFTRVGPHRADFILQRNGESVGLSRGQLKLTACLMQLAWDAAEMAVTKTPAIWLLDDLLCDLDDAVADRLVSLFVEGSRQCLFTAIGSDPVRLLGRLPADTRLFRVNRGEIAIQA